MKRTVLLPMAALMLAAAGQAAFAQSGQGGWIVSETMSPVDYSPQVSATVPGNGEGSLSVHCRRGRTEVTMSVLNFARYTVGAQVAATVSVNGGEAVRQAWTQDSGPAATGATATLVLRGDPVRFLRSLPTNGRMSVRVSDRDGVPHDTEFPLEGLETVRDKVSATCRWPPR
jgi:hypothetical protein